MHRNRAASRGVRAWRSTLAVVSGLALSAAALAGVAGVVGVTGATSAGAATPGVLDVPAGTVLTFKGITLSGCNSLSWGYQLGDAAPVTVNSKAYDCSQPYTFPDLTLDPVPSATTLRVFLNDITCEATFNSDGTPVAHAVTSGTNPWLVGIADGGGYCERVDTPATDFTLPGGNLSLSVSSTPPLTVQKQVTGDDPGVSFPIQVSCSADGRLLAGVGAAAASSQIDLSGPGASDTVTVNLKNGEQAAIPLVLGDPAITSVTCQTSESLSGVTLPTGWSCATPAIAPATVTYANGEFSAGPVVVTNTCTAPATPAATEVVLAPAFTG